MPYFWIEIFKVIKSSKGMLFGLDARIAILIFAVISTMIGYLSYGKVEQARYAAILKDLESIDKAYERLVADMGTFPKYALNQTSNGYIDTDMLFSDEVIKNGLKKYWSGPYLTLAHPENYHVEYAQGDSGLSCYTKTDCYLWIVQEGLTEDIWKFINAYVDENYGETPEFEGNKHLVGRIQGREENGLWNIYYRSIKRKKVSF